MIKIRALNRTCILHSVNKPSQLSFHNKTNKRNCVLGCNSNMRVAPENKVNKVKQIKTKTTYDGGSLYAGDPRL